MQKVCEYCDKPYKTKDSRQQTCGLSACMAEHRLYRRQSVEIAVIEVPRTSQAHSYQASPLPDPEELPAPYAKRVHDMWADLVASKSHNTTRIA